MVVWRMNVGNGEVKKDIGGAMKDINALGGKFNLFEGKVDACKQPP